MDELIRIPNGYDIPRDSAKAANLEHASGQLSGFGTVEDLQ